MNDRSRTLRLAAIGAAAGVLAFVAALGPTAGYAQDTRPVRPSPEHCLKQCDERALASYQACVAAHPDSEARCAARAREAAQKCKQGCGRETKPPSAIGACHRDCSAKARELHKTCLDRGGDPATCSETARASLRACNAVCPRPEPRPNLNCDRLCAEAAEHAEKRCLNAGGSAERCSALAKSTLDKCAERCARADKPAPGTGPRPR